MTPAEFAEQWYRVRSTEYIIPEILKQITDSSMYLEST